MQYKIPQDVQREDRIIGPLTMRQLIICGIGFSIDYAIYSALGREYTLVTVLIPIIPLTLITLAFAFFKPLDINFEKFILYWMEAKFILPKQRFWLKGTGDPLRYEYLPSIKKSTVKAKIEEKQAKKQSLDEITKILDSQNK